MEIFGAFQKRMTLNAFECFSDRCLEHVLAKGLTNPFEQRSPYYTLIEFDNAAESDMETALGVFEHCAEQGWAADGVVSENETQAKDLWRLREDITESIAHFEPYKNDVAVPVAQVATFLRAIDELFEREYPDFQVLNFGHVGDGNLHVNVLKPAAMAKADFVTHCERVNEQLFSIIQELDGSVSAEHGVGLTKKPYLHYSRSALEVDYMRAMKRVFDPNGIMNPGKIFD